MLCYNVKMAAKKPRVINRYSGKLTLTPSMSEDETKALSSFWGLISEHAPTIRTCDKSVREVYMNRWRTAASDFFGFSFSDSQATQMIWGWSPHIVIPKDGKTIKVNKAQHNRSNLRPSLYMLWYFFFSKKAAARAISPDRFGSFGAREMKGTIKGLSIDSHHFWTYDVENEVIMSRPGTGGTFDKPVWGGSVLKENNFSMEKEFGNVLFVINAIDIVAEVKPGIARSAMRRI